MGKISISRLISGTLMIAGTTVGAGMLGIPLVTANAGFWPAIAITGGVWIFMLLTGYLFLEVSLSMPDESNILSIAGKFFGTKGKVVVGILFAFLYYCLLVAYFAAGAPILAEFLGISTQSWFSYVLFGLIFGAIVAKGMKCIDWVNIILVSIMVVSYICLIGIGSTEVNASRLLTQKWGSVLFAIPVLFSAFGYHNVIPSLCTYLKRDRKTLRLSILCGTALPFAIYGIWQWLLIGSISPEELLRTQEAGLPVTAALQSIVGNPWIYRVGQYFAFSAIVTSLLGVAFSMVDFLGDGLKMKRTGLHRVVLTVLTFCPPFIFAVLDPTIFDKALGIAGGIGESLLNGLLPVALVWAGKYAYNRIKLSTLFAISVFVMLLEIVLLIR